MKFVYLSAVRDDAAGFLDAEWLSPRPNSDTAVMLGLAHTLVAENLHDIQFLERYCACWEKFAPYLLGARDGVPKDAAWAAHLSGLPAETIRALARRMAAHRTLITVSWSLQRADHGEQPYWMAITLAAMLGQIGLPGGGIGFGYGGTNGIGAAGAPDSVPPTLPQGIESHRAPSFRSRALPTCWRIPAARFHTTAARWRIRMLRASFTGAGGNPFHHHQDLGRLTRALAKPGNRDRS